MISNIATIVLISIALMAVVPNEAMAQQDPDSPVARKEVKERGFLQTTTGRFVGVSLGLAGIGTALFILRFRSYKAERLRKERALHTALSTECSILGQDSLAKEEES